VSKPDLERTAYTIECFLNALRMNDGLARTKVEVGIVRWLASSVRAKDDSAVYSKSVIDCFSRGRNLKSYEIPEITLDKAVWTDGSQISEIDHDEYLSTGKIVKLGMEGLDLSMPAGPAAEVSPGCSNSSDNSTKE
jgi:hypothetical protein